MTDSIAEPSPGPVERSAIDNRPMAHCRNCGKFIVYYRGDWVHAWAPGWDGRNPVAGQPGVPQGTTACDLDTTGLNKAAVKRPVKLPSDDSAGQTPEMLQAAALVDQVADTLSRRAVRYAAKGTAVLTDSRLLQDAYEGADDVMRGHLAGITASLLGRLYWGRSRLEAAHSITVLLDRQSKGKDGGWSTAILNAMTSQRLIDPRKS